ncbi:DUF4175 family protein [Catalinimonas niigatensis]|uniref:DUF4175 family protein n=1 Tax=Catalinimonas niigatensis TaxID=1397264 RepID=UPI002665DF65|nr:DUF4175 family protein [Catalinimonas niigatensis]WPP48122.1 DUF4175 family protein [Catalinimonas niigatensis]
MATEANINNVITQLKLYKRKFYLNKLTRGSIYFGAALLSVYLFISSLEYTIRLNSVGRTILFFLFVAVFLFMLYKWIIDPLFRISNNKRQISDEEAAKQIGVFFPEVKDKLLNVLQLHKSSSVDSALLSASIAQKTQQISVVSFPVAINIRENLRYIKYLAVPAILVLFLFVSIPQLFSESNNRIVNFNKEFVPEAPFTFQLQNKELLAFKNEDFTVDLALDGEAIPEKVYLNNAGRKFRMAPNEAGIFQYSFQNIQRDTRFSIEAAGFSTQEYDIKVVERPNLKDFSVFLNYPDYVGKEDQRLDNTGNLQVPEGTKVTWKFNALASDSMQLTFVDEEEVFQLEQEKNQIFSFEKQVFQADHYQIDLKNQYSSNKQNIRYFLDVTPDQHPKINLEQFQDTTMYQFLVLGGNVSDDYGLTQLAIFYKFEKAGENDSPNDKYQRINLSLDTRQNNQSYYHQWKIDSFNLEPGDKIRYFLQVWDNDGVNGYKASSTSSYVFSIPDKEAIKESLNRSSEQTQTQISKTVQQAEQLKNEIENVEKKLKGKKELSWQDKQKLEDILKRREELEKELQEMREQNEAANMKRDQFSQQSEKLKEKMDQLQKLMDELLDEETKKLYEELKKLLEEQAELDKIQNKLQELGDKEQNLEEELERSLELFKRMKFDMKLEELENELSEKAEEQKKLAEESGDKEKNTEELSEKQEELNKDFEEFKKDMEELEEMNQDMKHPEPMQDMSEEEQQIQEEQQKAKESLDKGKRKDAQKSQQNSSNEMKKMAEKMQQMQQSMEMEMLQENMDNLRNILDNLITLSFDQEDIMKSFRDVKQTDPRFIDLSQQQLKLRDDAQIIEDSLLSLAERVFQIQSFITREVKDMNQYMEESLESLKERQQYKAISKQQFSMSSMNNLALLLNDVLSQMQQQMADAMGNPHKKPGQSQQNMSMSELQRQLNEQVDELRKSGKSGRALSEELAKLASEQEKIRKMMQEIKQSEKEGGGGAGDELSKKMEETETDLVNKKLSSEMIERQKEIMTRLLEVEKSMREQELDDERKGETAKSEYERKASKSFEEYIKTKKQEIELLKTVPVKLNPYYKNEANKYFQRINNNSK